MAVSLTCVYKPTIQSKETPPTEVVLALLADGIPATLIIHLLSSHNLGYRRCIFGLLQWSPYDSWRLTRFRTYSSLG